MEPSKQRSSESHGILRIHAHGEVPVTAIREYLAAIEHAYNSSLVFDQLISQASQIHEALRANQRDIEYQRRRDRSQRWDKSTGNLPLKGQLQLPISAMLWQSWWPPDPSKISAFVPEEQKLKLKSVVLQSPGFWDVIGKWNPLEILRLSLNDRHERSKDKDYRNLAEARKLELENKMLENRLIAEKIAILRDLGATQTDISVLKSQLLGQPLQELGRFQERGLISSAELANPDGTFAFDRTPNDLKRHFDAL